MARLIVSIRAKRDTADIVAYLAAEAGRSTAIKYLDLFDDLYNTLARFPESGAPRPKLGKAVRISLMAPYIVIYEYAAETDTVIVLRVVHGSRRITAKLLTR